MEVFLYNSTVCRLCGEENDNGTLLYSSEENNQNLCEIINTYLPMKVSDDGELPRTICPGCTIQLEATVEFLNLIINGQKIIRELYQREKEYKKNILNAPTPGVISEKIIYEINTSDGAYHVEHPISLQVAGLEKPKRKRGRPPKKPKSPEELAQEAAAKEKQELISKINNKEDEQPSGKRRRKTPTRFKEAVQGKELERIFMEKGVIDADESDQERKSDGEIPLKTPTVREPEVIGHLEDSGELVVVVKGIGRGRPKGRMRQTREQCAICGMEFSSVGRYMSHVAQHGPVQFLCGCGTAFPTRLRFEDHQEETGHTGRTVQPLPKAIEKKTQTKEITLEAKNVSEKPVASSEKVEEINNTIISKELPDLSDVSRLETAKPENTNQEPIDVVADEPTSVKTESNNTDSVNEIPNDEEVQTEKGKVKIKCNYCDKLFSTRQSKSLHIKAAHLGEKAFACGECGARFAYPQSLAVHRVAHRRTRPARGYACDLCGKVLNHPSSVVYHKQAEHAAQRYVCGTCGKHFRHRQLLQRHQLVHSQARPFTCKTCNATFKTKANLLNHQLLHSGVKKFSCDICRQRFAHKTSLTLHMRWHTGVKPFSCFVCGKSFSQKGNLSEHERIHTGEKPYQCGECPRRFTTSSQHRLHARRHAARAALAPAQDRPHCGKCGKRMASRNAWALHVRRDKCSARAQRRLLERSKQPHKQISLLVTDKSQQVGHEEGEVQQNIQLEEEAETETEERVIYVAYDADDVDAPAFHILDPEQAVNIEENKVLTTCELYSGSSLLVPQQLEALKMDLQPEVLELEEEQEMELETDQLMLDGENIPVTDEAGNPLHFTMQDGTKLAITSIDGKTLQVITQDGQTIPVEINGYNNEEDAEAMAKGAEEAPVTHFYALV
ncbi:unnamed protein product, partial [Brenthis ino]